MRVKSSPPSDIKYVARRDDGTLRVTATTSLNEVREVEMIAQDIFCCHAEWGDTITLTGRVTGQNLPNPALSSWVALEVWEFEDYVYYSSME